jgi:hypothetical protein
MSVYQDLTKLYTKPCVFCEKPAQPFEYKSDGICIECSIESNDWHVAHYTGLDGRCTKPYFLKRRLHLRELLNQTKIPKSDGLERENVTCKKCGKQFVALRINHLKFCGDCTHWKNRMDDLRLKHEAGRFSE